jgi:hypothetical protein
MQTLDGYRTTHSDLRQMVDDLRTLLTEEHLRLASNARTAYEQLCDLGEQVSRHLTEEDHNVFPALLMHEDPKVKSIAWGFISGEGLMRKTFEDYYSRWLKNCDFNFGGEFLAETGEMFAMVGQRLEREERVLLPKMVEIGMLREAASIKIPATWARRVRSQAILA